MAWHFRSRKLMAPECLNTTRASLSTHFSEKVNCCWPTPSAPWTDDTASRSQSQIANDVNEDNNNVMDVRLFGPQWSVFFCDLSDAERRHWCTSDAKNRIRSRKSVSRPPSSTRTEITENRRFAS